MAGIPPNLHPPLQIVPYVPQPVNQMGFFHQYFPPDYWEQVQAHQRQHQQNMLFNQHNLRRELGPLLYNRYMGAALQLQPLINFNQSLPPTMPKLPTAPLNKILELIRLQHYRIEADHPRVVNSPDSPSSSSSGIGSGGTPQHDNSIILMVTDRLTTNTHFVRANQEDLTHHLNANCSLCKLQESIRVAERLQQDTSSLALTRSNGGNLFCFQRVLNNGFLDFGVRSVMLNGDRKELCVCQSHKLTKLFVLTSRGVIEIKGFLCPILRTGLLSEKRKSWSRPIHHPINKRYRVLKEFQDMFPDQVEVDFYVTIKDYQKFEAEDKTGWIHPLAPPPFKYVFELDVRHPTRKEVLEMKENAVLENHRRAMRQKFAEVSSLKKERDQLKNLLLSLLDTENLSPEARTRVEMTLGIQDVEPAVVVEEEVLKDQEDVVVEETEFARQQSPDPIVVTFDYLETDSDSFPEDEEPEDVQAADTHPIAPSDLLILPATPAEPTRSPQPVNIADAAAVFAELVNAPEYPAASTSGTSASDNTRDVAASPVHPRRSTDGSPWHPVGEYHPPETMTVSSVGQTAQLTPAPKWKGKAAEKFRVANNKERLELTNFNFF